MEKIILFYKFCELPDPAAIRLWQQSLASSLGLKGRIIIAPHGINGTLGGDLDSLRAYIKATKSYADFKNIEFKWSQADRQSFPRLSVKCRAELVSFQVADKIKLGEKGIEGGGQRLKPDQLHKLISERGDEVVLFDGRNRLEAAVGRFKNAVVPDVRYCRDLPAEIKKPKYAELKDRPVVTYCTGGIRCEVLSLLLKEEGFKEVYQLDGGIVKYGQKYGDDGLWEGSLYVFDGRVTTKFSKAARDIGSCSHCAKPSSRYDNCATCNDHILICEGCAKSIQRCPKHAETVVSLK